VSITTDKTQPVLFGGLVMGVLSALPLISAGNLCCCLWVISGGVVAAYVLQQNEPGPITQGDGALIGLLAGLVGAIICWVITIPITLLVAPMERRVIEQVLENGDLPPAFRDLLVSAQSGGFQILRFAVTVILWLVAGAIFSTLGGGLGAVVFAKKQPPGAIVPPPPLS